MDRLVSPVESVKRDSFSEGAPDSWAALTPVPITIAQTGISVQLLKDLLLKQVFGLALTTVRELSDGMALAGVVVEEIVQLLRDEALLELSSSRISRAELAFRLTERGRFQAQDALSRSGYSGPAPVALEHYHAVVAHGSLQKHRVSRAQVQALFADFVIEPDLLDRLGAALNAHRAMFVYGSAGAGKTYTISRCSQLFGDSCLIPHAIAVGDTIVPVYNPQLHQAQQAPSGAAVSLRYADSCDRRLVRCSRPVVMVGGELTLDQLEVIHEAETRLYRSPLQLQANNGLFIIDDMGRQAVSPKAIFNRWIVPMEERRDFLSLSNGQHFEVPFDVQLVFSSNINPLELADEAFLRRIGFKVRFGHIDAGAYARIWRQECDKQGVEFDAQLVDYVVDQLHRQYGVALAACHPRDLISTALSQVDYLSAERVLSPALMEWAWDAYFVQLDGGVS